MNKFPNSDQTFKAGVSGNPNGRPKKSFTLLNETLKKEGYEALTKSQLIEAYSLIFSLEEKRFGELAEDSEQPLSLRLILQELTDPQTRGKALDNYRDYMFGKAKEEIKTTGQMNVIWHEIKNYESNQETDISS